MRTALDGQFGLGHTTRNTGHATMGQATRIMGHATRIMGHVTRIMGHATRIMGHTTCYLGLMTSCNVVKVQDRPCYIIVGKRVVSIIIDVAMMKAR